MSLKNSPSYQQDNKYHPVKKRIPFKTQLLFLFFSFILLLSYCLLPGNRDWFKEHIIPYYEEVSFQRKHLSPAARMAGRFGNNYTVSMAIARKLKELGARNVLLLMPPSDLFKAHHLDYKVPEPAIFYYYTGIKTTWVTSPQAQEANWYGTVGPDNQLEIYSVHSRAKLDSVVALFKKYKTTL